MATAFVVVWIFAAVRPTDRGGFWLENLPVVAFAIAIVATYRRFRFSTRSYAHMLVFLVLHEIGAHHTYSQTPIGEWIASCFGFERNHYDRFVHFGFGVLMARPLAELLRRRFAVPATASGWLVVVGVLAISAAYELLESWTARIVSPELGTAFLGTQGDPWDAQKDMTAALLGVVVWRIGVDLVSRVAMARHPSAAGRPTL